LVFLFCGQPINLGLSFVFNALLRLEKGVLIFCPRATSDHPGLIFSLLFYVGRSERGVLFLFLWGRAEKGYIFGFCPCVAI
ncbi:MAG: hypothetical protein V6Z82_03720, partial [Flavobacteriales bacterium]